MCYTSHVVKKEKEEEDLQIFGADTHLKSWSAPTKSMRADGGELSDQLLHLPHTALAPTTFIILFYCWRPLSFFSPPFPSLLSSLAGRIKFNCIVYDRYEVRFGTNSRQTVHRHFMVSFHLSCWCVVVTHLTKTIQDGGLGGGDCVYVYWDRHSWEWTETKLLHRPIFNFQQPLTAPSSMPSSTSYNPILGEVWLVESKNRAVCSLSPFFTLWSVLQWWHPGGHLPTVIS